MAHFLRFVAEFWQRQFGKQINMMTLFRKNVFIQQLGRAKKKKRKPSLESDICFPANKLQT